MAQADQCDERVSLWIKLVVGLVAALVLLLILMRYKDLKTTYCLRMCLGMEKSTKAENQQNRTSTEGEPPTAAKADVGTGRELCETPSVEKAERPGVLPLHGLSAEPVSFITVIDKNDFKI